MSTTNLIEAPSAAEQPRAVQGRAGAQIPWARVALCCAVLIVAGGVRFWQEHRVNLELEKGKESPFALKSLPMVLGSWRVPGEREETIDPGVREILHYVDYMRRHYVNDQTGVGVDAMLLYGPATIAHKPEICYPGVGYEVVSGPRIQTFALPGGTATFYSLVVAKGEGGTLERQVIYYAVRYDRKWTVEFNFKRMNRVPGMYKLQLARRMGSSERLDMGKSEGRDPCEAFLEAMLPELEGRISGTR